jgi:hypothetical protein
MIRVVTHIYISPAADRFYWFEILHVSLCKFSCLSAVNLSYGLLLLPVRLLVIGSLDIQKGITVAVNIWTRSTVQFARF